MRRQLLFLTLFSGLCGGVQAQTAPSIVLADMPAVGDSLRLSQTTAVPASAPALTLNGPNKTWNYAGLVSAGQRVARFNAVSTATGFLIQYTFNNALLQPDNKATLVQPDNVPGAAGVSLPITDPMEFFNGSAADYRSVGFAGTLSGTAVPVTYASKPQQDILYKFPLTYTTAPFVSNSLLTTPAAVASTGYFSQKRQRTVLPDAWGTLTTPFGTFQTVRVVSTIIDHDSLAAGGMAGQGATLPTRREYSWLAKTIHVPLLTITTIVQASGVETVSAIEYRDIYRRVLNPLATQNAALAAGLGFYPNPSASGEALRLTVPAGSGALTVTGRDLLGRQLFSRSFASSVGGVLTLDAAALGDFRGVLLLTVQTAQGLATRRVVRE